MISRTGFPSVSLSYLGFKIELEWIGCCYSKHAELYISIRFLPSRFGRRRIFDGKERKRECMCKKVDTSDIMLHYFSLIVK